MEKVFQCPEEGNALQVTEEKGRVAKRRKAAADIGHHEDEEDNLMSSVFSVGVGSEKRPDKQHGRAGRSHPAGQHRADAQHGRIHGGSSDECTLEPHAAGHSEQSEEQNNEGDIIEQNRMQAFENRRIHTVNDCAGDKKRQAPENGNLAEVVIPEMRNNHGAKGNGKEHTGKGNGPVHGKLGAGKMRRGALSGRGHDRRQAGSHRAESRRKNKRPFTHKKKASLSRSGTYGRP